MRIWVDVANSPQVPLFVPLVEELRVRGHDVLITAWDRAQTAELARDAWPDVRVVGAGNQRGLLGKALLIAERARQLARHVRRWRPDVAVSHNSYSQVAVARLLRLPAITMMDYEHQPANHLSFRLAQRVLVPEAFPDADLRRLGAGRRSRRYPGFKEEVSLAPFRPDPEFRASLGVPEDAVLVASRPPPERALYHRHGNRLFDAAIGRAAGEGATVLVSPRDPEQARWYGERPGLRVLDRAVSGGDLLHHADLVIGAGGTMTREAAILGTPSYTVFAGRLGAVDRALIESGRLVRIGSDADLPRLRIEQRPPSTWTGDPAPVRRLTDLIEREASAVLRGRRRGGRVD